LRKRSPLKNRLNQGNNLLLDRRSLKTKEIEAQTPYSDLGLGNYTGRSSDSRRSIDGYEILNFSFMINLQLRI
jgi:hypothetical protein